MKRAVLLKVTALLLALLMVLSCLAGCDLGDDTPKGDDGTKAEGWDRTLPLSSPRTGSSVLSAVRRTNNSKHHSPKHGGNNG